MVRILLVDDHDVVRHGLRHLLEQQEGWAVCGEAASGRAAVELARSLTPDVAVIDVAMPDLNGLETTRQIRKASPRTEVLIFTMHESEQLVREVLAAGAKGYLLKSDAARSIVAAVEAVAARHPYFNWKVSETILDGFLRITNNSSGEGEAVGEPLTPREREIVQLIAEGCSNKETAIRLDISVKTVETHRAALMRKIGAHTIVDIIRYATRNKLASM
ncbi:response regulator transcription factor [Roseomonas sp. M0104]|uniref:Response regulator transcription factor n=1 Tax=Teichococcus coralli TaxID=2545983 RepID=A0A845BBQ9_9PROT|nr:response regulator transcription factor [Pseudoroseomonas coralli]MXP63556.1 response regulator transcription factor [Pseudoroseomonas coralli]